MTTSADIYKRNNDKQTNRQQQQNLRCVKLHSESHTANADAETSSIVVTVKHSTSVRMIQPIYDLYFSTNSTKVRQHKILLQIFYVYMQNYKALVFQPVEYVKSILGNHPGSNAECILTYLKCLH